MRRISFALTILFFLFLFILLNLPPKPLSHPNELSQYQPNQKFLVTGMVSKETFSQKSKIYHLDNDLQIHCDINCPNFLNQQIQATTILESYNDGLTLKVLKIEN